MTPEEHVVRAERLLALIEDPTDEADLSQNLLRTSKAQVHMLIAKYKKENPPESGRPVVNRPSMDNPPLPPSMRGFVNPGS